MENELPNSEPTQFAFVYDSRTGEIVHVHQFVPISPDGRCPIDEMTQTALTLAPSTFDRSELGVLHHEGVLELSHQVACRVDVAKNQLVREPPHQPLTPAEMDVTG
jgi:hypothetical protein